METVQVEFKQFWKIPRLKRGCVITEKIDGTNASIYIGPDGQFLVGSRTRWITPDSDNFGFAAWAYANKDSLMMLGEGFHYGEWWGPGIQRGYGLKEKKFSLFNSARWNGNPALPACCSVVPVISSGDFNSALVDEALNYLTVHGSVASPGFMRPEGVVIYHSASRSYFKKTIEGDDEYKGKNAAVSPA